ncbi:MAG: sigma 54 modulation/S30EA ribosomal C-terminal domain-containing protein [Acidimicrobiia bacterium]
MAKTKADWEIQREVRVIRVVRGAVSATDIAYAEEKLAHAARVAGGPVLQLEVRMTQHQDPARALHAYVEMSADINGRPTRAHWAAATMHEAIDGAAQRLTLHIERLRDRAQATHARLADPTTWHHGQALTARASGMYERPLEEREIRRRKVVDWPTETIDEAIFDLEILDHDFFAFTNLATGEANVVARERNRYRVVQQHPDPETIAGVVALVVLDPGTAPVCSIADARLLLEIEAPSANGHAHFVFFLDDVDGRPSVLYRRRDGHDGLIQAG